LHPDFERFVMGLMRSTLARIGFALAAVILASTAGAAAMIYDLGTLGGTSSYAYAINYSGQVVGASTTPGDAVTHAFLYTGTPGSGGAMADLGVGDNSQAYAINASGQVTGYSQQLPGGFLYTATTGGDGGGVAQKLFQPVAVGFGINDSGQVAGYGPPTPTALSQACLYSSDTHRTLFLGTLGGQSSLAFGINASGQVTGDSALTGTNLRQAFLYTGTPGQGGAMVNLGTLTGAGGSSGRAINDSGQVTGYSSAAGSLHAFLYTGTPGSGGHMLDLGTLGGKASIGFGINASGQVVGYSTTETGGQHAFLYTGAPGVDGGMIDLDAWLDATDPTDGANWTLNNARGINDNGLIAGYGDYEGATHAFLLDASSLIPEPAFFSILLPVVVHAATRRRRAARRAAHRSSTTNSTREQ
jgi:probable HAF family extracellular repeat protein